MLQTALNLNYQPVRFVGTEGLTEAEWLDYRRSGIGGSDVAAVPGQSPFCKTFQNCKQNCRKEGLLFLEMRLMILWNRFIFSGNRWCKKVAL